MSCQTPPSRILLHSTNHMTVDYPWYMILFAGITAASTLIGGVTVIASYQRTKNLVEAQTEQAKANTAEVEKRELREEIRSEVQAMIVQQEKNS